MAPLSTPYATEVQRLSQHGVVPRSQIQTKTPSQVKQTSQLDLTARAPRLLHEPATAMPPPSSRTSKKQSAGKPAAMPRQRTLEIYTSTSTGHQVGSGISKSSTWRQSRASKLNQQYRNGTSSVANPTSISTTSRPAKQSNPTSCSGNPAPKTATGTSAKPQIPVYTLGPQNKPLCKAITASPASSPAKPLTPLHSPSNRNHSPKPSQATTPASSAAPTGSTPTSISPKIALLSTSAEPPTVSPPPKLIFNGCRIYISGTTYPIISDRELKCQLATHGARICLTVGRSFTTHVIVAKPSNSSTLTGTGGGLAAGKLQKEIQSRANHIKYVSVQWAMDCIKTQKRLAESRYSILSIRSGKQQSITSMLPKSPVTTIEENKENDVST